MPAQNSDTMQKPTILLLSMAALLAAGLGMGTFSSSMIFDDLSVGTGMVDVGAPLEINAEIERGAGGVYAVEMMDHTEGMSIKATVLGPLRAVTTSATIDESIYEERFPVDETHRYTLVIETDFDPVSVTAVIGPEPDETATSLGLIASYMLLVGVVGMIASTVYLIIHRRRINSGSYPSL